jgi:NAD(P)-binding Rossmann-like domain
MALPKLVPTAQQVHVQDTTLSTDVLGRHVYSTWQEATSNSGPPLSAVVGAGIYGAYCAAKLSRHQPGQRVLVLDAGRFPGRRAPPEPGPGRP